MCIHMYIHTHFTSATLSWKLYVHTWGLCVICIHTTYKPVCGHIYKQCLCLCVCTCVCSNLQTFLLQTWNFDRNGKLYSHTQDNHCIRITALPQPRFSRLAVGWAATAGGGVGLAIFVICGLVYLKKQHLACCGQYSGVAPEGKEEDEIVGYTELEVNSCDWPMERRQVHTYIHAAITSGHIPH